MKRRGQTTTKNTGLMNEVCSRNPGTNGASQMCGRPALSEKENHLNVYLSSSPSLFPISFQVVVSCVSDNWLFSMRDE